MNQQHVDTFILTNNKYFREYQLPLVRNLLTQAEDVKWMSLQITHFKDPIVSLILSQIGRASCRERVLRLV